MGGKTDRRTILKHVPALATVALLPAGCAMGKNYPGTLGGPNMKRGHALRDNGFPAPSSTAQRSGIVIAGGGVSGLAAAWTLLRAGFSDFRLYELEDEVGGNARSGRNAISAYPLGAHYLPVANKEARALRIMLEQFGIITGIDNMGVPRYDPEQLCADLDERLLWRGRWQEGLYPKAGLSGDDQKQRDAFFALMDNYKSAVGVDGKPAFAIPMAYSSKDPRFIKLDQYNFAHWLATHAFTSKPLLAHIRYCCRDDYGSEPERISAWAGIHYFASRRGWAADNAGDRELTWSEGNGRLVALMREQVRAHIRTKTPVFKITPDSGGASIDYFDAENGQSVRTKAKAAILAMPHFISRKIAPMAVQAGTYNYAPWVVANITVSRLPKGPGVARAWDNVSASSESLGYVVATHQTSSAASGPGVLTWYMPLSRQSPQEARKILLKQTLVQWQNIVAKDLLSMNPDMQDAIDRIDVWLWGHAMARPEAGFLENAINGSAPYGDSKLFRAHSDTSGLSLFEEAHYRGVAAAESAMRALGHDFVSIL